MTISDIEEILEEYQECKPGLFSKKVIYDYTNNLAKIIEKKISRIEELDWFEFIKKIGGGIHSFAFSQFSKIKGTIFIHGRKKFDIIIPEWTSPLQDKFTLAHELGHYVLHADSGRKSKLYATRFGSNQLEWEANWFAAGLLIPKFKLEKCVENSSFEKKANEEKIHFLSVHFLVSKKVAEYRLKTYEESGY